MRPSLHAAHLQALGTNGQGGSKGPKARPEHEQVAALLAAAAEKEETAREAALDVAFRQVLGQEALESMDPGGLDRARMLPGDGPSSTPHSTKHLPCTALACRSGDRDPATGELIRHGPEVVAERLGLPSVDRCGVP